MDSSSDEDPNVCPVCSDRNDPNPTDNKNRMIGCDGSCEKWFHWTCVGINQTNKPGKKDDWFCKKCSSKILALKLNNNAEENESLICINSTHFSF